MIVADRGVGMNSSVYHRTDNGKRTVERAAADIKSGTLLEADLFREWSEVVLRQGLLRSVSYRSYGVDNTGEWIDRPTAGMDNPDFDVDMVAGSLPLTGNFKVESKWDPVFWKMTFKRCNLEAYIRHRALMLVICGNGDRSTRPHYWTVVGPEQMRAILDKGVEPCREYGDKPGVRLLRAKGDYERFLGPVYTWSGDLVFPGNPIR
jgi:hypothetical protein